MLNKDILAAVPDASALSMGARIRAAHPLADSVPEGLAKLACAIGANLPNARADLPRSALIGMGATSSDFSKVLADACQLLVTQVFEAAAGYLEFCGEVELADFKPATAGGIDVNIELQAVSENAPIGFSFVQESAGNTIQLATYAKLLGFSRQTIINDNIQIVANTMRALATSAAATEAGLIATALEGNPILDDGEPTFHDALGNVVDFAGFDPISPDAFEAGMSKLRTQPLSGGGKANLEARHLVVAPDLEFPALSLLHSSGFAERIAVSVLPGLPAGRWYMLADPAVIPAIGRLKLRGSNNPVLVEMQPRTMATIFDGVMIRSRADLGAALLGRVGIVRGGVL